MQKSHRNSLDWLICPWLAISLGLHGLLLFLPLPAQPPQPADRATADPLETTDSVQVVKLPAEIPPSPSPAQLVKPVKPASPVAAASPTPIPPRPAAVARPTVRPSPSVAIPQSPAPAASPVPSPIPSPVLASPSPLPSPTPDPLANFPHIAQAQVGCLNSKQCWQTSDTQWRTISSTVKQQLENQGYILEAVPLDDETGRQMYRVLKANETAYFLSFISTTQGTVYLITQQPMTPEEMQQVSGL